MELQNILNHASKLHLYTIAAGIETIAAGKRTRRVYETKVSAERKEQIKSFIGVTALVIMLVGVIIASLAVCAYRTALSWVKRQWSVQVQDFRMFHLSVSGKSAIPYETMTRQQSLIDWAHQLETK